MTEFSGYFIKAFGGIKVYIGVIISWVGWLLFPDGAFITAFYGVIGAMILDIISKYWAIITISGGLNPAIETKKLYSRTLWDGTKIKLFSYLVVFILVGLGYRVTVLEHASVFLGTVVYSVIFLREAQSVIENLIDGGAKLNWLLFYLKKKENNVLNGGDGIEQVQDDEFRGTI